MLGFPWKIASRYLWSKRGEAFITLISVISVLGVAIGVMVLVVTMAVMTGFERELKERITGTNSHILVRSFTGKISRWRDALAEIEKIQGVDSAAAFTQHQALLRVRDRSSGLLVRGIQQGGSAAAQLAQFQHEDPSRMSLFDPPPITVRNEQGQEEEVELPALVIGQELARTMGLSVGTPVSILTPQVSSSPFGLMPRFKRFVVAGIYSSGLVEYESGLAYASLEEAQRFFNFGGAVSGIEVRVRDLNTSPEITKEIMRRLSSQGVYAQDWTELNRPLWEALNLEKRVYFIVLLLIIVMASFSIITTLVMLVLEKRKDIAILRTMGATASNVWTIFFLQGAVIGAVGTLLGLAFGYGGCVALRAYGFPLDERVFQMSTVPVRIEGENFALVGLSAFLICCIATIYPAWRASHLHPSEVLRYE